MVIFAKAYNSIKSAFSVKETNGKWTTSPKQSNTSVLNTKTEKAHILIHSSSISTKGLFVSREHNQQNQPRHASQHAQQQMQRQNAPAALDQRCHEFHELHKLLPYDILCLIFDALDFMDLWRCTNVCQAWCSFMLEWPEFWRKLTIEIPHVKRSMLEPLLRRQAHEFRLEGQLSREHMHVLLTVLLYSESHFIRKLYFSNQEFRHEDADFLAKALRSTSPSAKQVDFVDCHFPGYKVIDPILGACTNFAHVSFSLSKHAPKDYQVSPPKKNQIIMPSVEFSSLVYLKLSFQYKNYASADDVQKGRLSGILCQCPNLVHLFLDSGGSIPQGHCLIQALKHCPRLESAVISDKAEMPPTIISEISETELATHYTASNSIDCQEPAKGVRRLVLSGGNIKLDHNAIASIFKKTHKSLELLYLHYTGSGPIGSHALSKLASHGAPRLRELRLSTEATSFRDGGDPASTTKALASLLSHCPALEAIQIIDTYSQGDKYHPTGSFLFTSDDVLRAAAENCPLLRYLKIVGQFRHPADSVLRLAVPGSHLSYLEVDMEHDGVLDVVKRLPSLKTLYVRNDLYIGDSPMPENHRITAQCILQERGGTLILV